MVRIDFFSELQVRRDAGQTDDMLRAEVQRIMDELVVLESVGCKISDAAVSLDLANDRVEIELISWGDDFDRAAVNAHSCLRSAIHAAGAGTPEWAWDELARNTVQHRELTDA